MSAIPTSWNRPQHEHPRQKLVLAALKLFAEKGFNGASTREIVDAAGANISAIRYYFGDKAGLYRAAFFEPLADNPCSAGAEMDLALPAPEMLYRFFAEFLSPLKQGEATRLVMKLHFREMVEPTGVWAQEIETQIKPQVAALVRMLTHRFGMVAPDLEVQRMAFAIIGMAVQYFVGQDIVQSIAPELIATPEAIDTLAQSVARYAHAIIEAEVALRRQSPKSGALS